MSDILQAGHITVQIIERPNQRTISDNQSIAKNQYHQPKTLPYLSDRLSVCLSGQSPRSSLQDFTSQLLLYDCCCLDSAAASQYIAMASAVAHKATTNQVSVKSSEWRHHTYS